MSYRTHIAAIVPGYEPRHIEAFMRAEHGTLDHLSPAQFADAAIMAALCVEEGGIEFAERIANTYGMAAP